MSTNLDILKEIFLSCVTVYETLFIQKHIFIYINLDYLKEFAFMVLGYIFNRMFILIKCFQWSCRIPFLLFYIFPRFSIKKEILFFYICYLFSIKWFLMYARKMYKKLHNVAFVTVSTYVLQLLWKSVVKNLTFQIKISISRPKARWRNTRLLRNSKDFSSNIKNRRACINSDLRYGK